MNGLSLSQLTCTCCHVVGLGRLSAYNGPRMPQTIDHKVLDADALRAWLNGAHRQMPNFRHDLSQQQIEDLAAYLRTFRIR